MKGRGRSKRPEGDRRQKRSCSCDKQDGVYDFGYSQSDKRSAADGRHAQ